MRRQEVFVSKFRSGPVSNHRLARFHLAAVVDAGTAKYGAIAATS
jgi:hypothetical protein